MVVCVAVVLGSLFRIVFIILRPRHTVLSRRTSSAKFWISNKERGRIRDPNDEVMRAVRDSTSGSTLQEISRLVGSSPAAVRLRLHRLEARGKVRRHMTDSGCIWADSANLPVTGEVRTPADRTEARRATSDALCHLYLKIHSGYNANYNARVAPMCYWGILVGAVWGVGDLLVLTLGDMRGLRASGLPKTA